LYSLSPKVSRVWHTSRRGSLTKVEPSKDSYNNSVQLKEYIRAPYIALSHSWGKTRHIVTEKKNIENHKRGIPLDSLPKTFQDAVELTKSIGLRYIWIDSLCIIQDDTNDWKNEAAKMAEVYRNARCTVAATGSKGDQEGIFLERLQQDIINLRYNAANTFIAATYSEEDVASMIELHKSPLSTRAWTMQERLLSRRTIHFTKSRVIWECCTRAETEDDLVLGPEDFGSILTQTLFEFSTTRSKWITLLHAVGRERRISRLTEVSKLRTPGTGGVVPRTTIASHRQELTLPLDANMLSSATFPLYLPSIRSSPLKIQQSMVLPYRRLQPTRSH
jgi:hypothetical protein